MTTHYTQLLTHAHLGRALNCLWSCTVQQEKRYIELPLRGKDAASLAQTLPAANKQRQNRYNRYCLRCRPTRLDGLERAPTQNGLSTSKTLLDSLGLCILLVENQGHTPARVGHSDWRNLFDLTSPSLRRLGCQKSTFAVSVLGAIGDRDR